LEILIGLGIIALVIYLVVRLLIAIGPYLITVILFIIGAGGVVGLVVGTFYGIKNYMSSISDNISNKAFKITMIIITVLFIIIVFMYMIAAVYYFFNFIN